MMKSRVALFILALIIVVGMCSRYAFTHVFVNGLPASVALSGTSSHELRELIFTHYKHLVGIDSAHTFLPGEYTLKSIYIDMNNDDKRDIILTLESDYTCGSGGCLASIFMRNEIGSFEPMKKFAYAVKNIEPLETFTNGMRDLRINTDTSHVMIWNGESYTLESI